MPLCAGRAIAYRERLKGMAMPTAVARSAPNTWRGLHHALFGGRTADANMAAVTQTLLSNFGSRFVTPQSGITMNNGIMWSIPTPGGPNSLAAGKRCLTNYKRLWSRTPPTDEGLRSALPAAGASCRP